MKTQKSASITTLFTTLTMTFVLAFIFSSCQKDESPTLSNDNSSNSSNVSSLTKGLAQARSEDVISLNLKLFIEGYLMPGERKMKSVLLNSDVAESTARDCDIIYVDLHLRSEPQTIAYTATAILDISGEAIVTFPKSALSNGPYWIAVRNRTMVETWSSNTVEFSAATTYDFTTESASAFYNNMKEVQPGVWAMYSGDIDDGSFTATQDGFVDGSDFVQVDMEIENRMSGYNVSDLNGDGKSTETDMGILDRNMQFGVQRIRPIDL